MIYSGKQIRIELKNGKTEVWLGSHWTLRVDKNRATVYGYTGGDYIHFETKDIVSVKEDHYSAMEL
jgi:hypothetical protein